MSPLKQIAYSRAALRSLRRMPSKTANRIRAKVKQYAAAPESLANNVSTLKGDPGYLRLRVGEWRVVFSEDSEILAIIRVAPRGQAYD